MYQGSYENLSSLEIARKIMYDVIQMGVLAEVPAAAELGISDILDTGEMSYTDIAKAIPAD